MLQSAGFEIIETTRPYSIPYGVSHPKLRSPRARAHQVLQRAVAGGVGVPHAAALARPAI
jgi:hypothetical protein